jgi:hypothetical protein
MQRRKYLAALGSLAAGGAAIGGTGAFAVSTVDRSISVNTAGDGSAYMGFNPTSDYAYIRSGGKFTLEFDSLNQDANTAFRNVFQITNNGSNDLQFQLIDGRSTDSPNGFIGFPDNSPMTLSWSDEADEGTSWSNLNAFPNSPIPLDGDPGTSPTSSPLKLGSGNSAYVHVDFWLDNDDVRVTDEINTSLGAVPDEIGFYASALPQDGDL